MSDFINIIEPTSKKLTGAKENTIVEVHTEKTDFAVFFEYEYDPDPLRPYLPKETKSIEIELQKYNNRFSFDMKPFLQVLFPQTRDDYDYKGTRDEYLKNVTFRIVLGGTEHFIKKSVYNGKDIEKVNSFKKPHFEGYPQSLSRLHISSGSEYDFNRIVRNPAYFAANTDSYRRFFTRVVNESGLFLKWLNKFGTWSYWLFEDVYEESRKVKVGTIIDNPFYQLSGKDIIETMPNTVSKSWRLQSITPVHADEFEELNTLFESTQVYLYTGVKNTTGRNYEIDPNLWKRVYLSDITSKHVIDKHNIFDFEVTINFRDNE